MKAFSVKAKRGKAVQTKSDVITLYPSQEEAWNAIEDEQYAILNAPTGWGKSLTLCAMLGNRLLDNPNRKALIVIPQTVISKGFVGSVDIDLPNGERLEWRVRHNLCGDERDKIAILKKWLLSPAGDSLADRVCVATHTAIALAFADFTEEEIKTAFRNLDLAIDEAHHIQASMEGFNQLGKLVSDLLIIGDPSASLVLSTAFFFRGDSLSIIQKEHLEKFTRHAIPFDVYWDSLRYLKQYLYDFVAYKGSVWKETEALLEQSQTPTLFFVPWDGHKLHLGKGKSTFVKRLCRMIKSHYDNVEMWTPKHKLNGKQIIIDFVEQKHRMEKVKFAIEHGDKIAAIITVGMFREGADWLECERIIDLIPSGSDQDRNQRFGRLIRDNPGKESVSYSSFFPHISDAPKEEQRKELTKLYAHFHASLVLENALSPIRIPINNRNTDSNGNGRSGSVNLMGRFSEQQQESILGDAHEALIKLVDDFDKQGSVVQHDDARDAVVSVLKTYEVKQHLKETAKQIILILRRRANVNLPVAELVKAGFDKVWGSDALKGFVMFSAGFGGATTLSEIRRTIQNVFLTKWYENYRKIKDLSTCPPEQDRSYWWITHNKVMHANGELSKERESLLESISWWKWQTSKDDRWMSRFSELKEIGLPEYGSILYGWCSKQRRHYHRGSLPADRIQLLESIDGWFWTPPDRWMDTYSELASLPKAPHNKQHPKLWNCVYQMQARYAKGELSTERVELLEKIRWWQWSKPDRWRVSFEKLANGDYPKSKTRRYKFMVTCRTAYKNGKMSPERIALCESIPWWKW